MNVEIISERDNPVLSRKEVLLLAKYEGATPSLTELRQKVVETLGVSPELMVIKKTEQNFGKREVKIWAYVYDNPDVLRRLEPIYVLKRNKLATA
ncbi:MAG: 30S ribosomal protein S24e [Candidatus Micrarchaeota archaeon]|nr:30S ribosomal protein S24e [Candidatus Micrarchaeota archaeon]